MTSHLSISCPNGLGANTTVLIGGEPLTNVRSVSINIESDDIVTATLVLENPDVSVTPHDYSRETAHETAHDKPEHGL